MENEAPLDFIAGSGFLLDDFLGSGSERGGIALRAAEKEAPVESSSTRPRVWSLASIWRRGRRLPFFTWRARERSSMETGSF